MKIDLHVHSKYSKRPSEWILKKLGCPESFTEPSKLYDIAMKRGMSMVTITDHNTIEGCLEIADKPGVFTSEEVTTYHPEDGCKFHVLVYDIDENIHKDLQEVRLNIFELIPYLREKGITHSLAHPLYSVNGKLDKDHVERCLVLFNNFEQNGARGETQNQRLRNILEALTPDRILKFAEKHRLEKFLTPETGKYLTGGSDDHSSLTIARRYTYVEGAIFKNDFFHGLEIGKAVIKGHGSHPETLAQNIYSIAYQFYEDKFGLSKYVNSDVVFKFLDKFLLGELEREPRLIARLHFFWNNRKRKNTEADDEQKVIQLIRKEAHNIIRDEPNLLISTGNETITDENLDQKWFEFVNRISNRLLKNFANQMIDSMAGADILNVFQSLGSAGALYAVMAPYFVSYSIFSLDRRFSSEMLDHFQGSPDRLLTSIKELNVAHFTDTFYEVNGVTGTLKKQIEEARSKNRRYTVITCDERNSVPGARVKNFRPIGVYELSVYPEQKLFYPPFLEILSYCYQKEFNQIHAATPGPIGLAAMAIARILKVPFVGTYHTALPQYAQYLTEDPAIANMVWRYIIWFYDQMDTIFVPSRATAQELVEHGISKSKIRLTPRGVDSREFHPEKRNPDMLRDELGIPEGFKLLYVGRVSKEKNLKLLENAFTKLAVFKKNIQLVIVGDGPYFDEMRHNLKDFPAYFTGYLTGERLRSVFASCDLFVFPSVTDTFGNVVLEAQASGLPVIVTDQGGPCENIVDGKTGFIIKGNNEQELLRSMNKAISSPSTLKEMGILARRYAESRSLNKAFDGIWRLYEQAHDEKSHETRQTTVSIFDGKSAANF